MFTAPGPSSHGQGQVKQVIDLTEDSKTLLHILSAIYPMDPIIPDTLEDALSLLSACQKYQTDSTAIRIRALIRGCTPPLFTAENSFRAYGISSRYHLEEEALHAARLTLERSMDFNTLGEDLRFISGADLFQLYEYRKECTKAAMDCIDKMTDYKLPSISFPCPRSVDINKYDTEELWSVPRWWHGHFRSRIADLPSPKIITDRPAFERVVALHHTMSHCSVCLQPDEARIDNIICAAFEAKLTAVIEQVSPHHALGRTPELICTAGPSRYSNIVSYAGLFLCFDVFCAIETCGEIWSET